MPIHKFLPKSSESAICRPADKGTLPQYVAITALRVTLADYWGPKRQLQPPLPNALGFFHARTVSERRFEEI